MPKKKLRVVVIPGLMGSSLIDTRLSKFNAAKICGKNLGAIREAALLVITGSRPCGKGAKNIWGRIGSFHWLFEPKEKSQLKRIYNMVTRDKWISRFLRGDCYKNSEGIHANGFTEATIKIKNKKIVDFRPYGNLVNALSNENFDVLPFYYDWRLSVQTNAKKLEESIISRWWKRGLGSRDDINLNDQIVLIGHSLGGLVARYFIESEKIGGYKIVRKLITIGTPHEGAPEAYTHFTNLTHPFGKNPYLEWLSKTNLPPPADRLAKDIDPYIIPLEHQNKISKSLTSIIELMPTYPFVRRKGRNQPPESIDITYRSLRRHLKPDNVKRIHSDFRDVLIPTSNLDSWLLRHQVEYSFVGLDSVETIVGVTRRLRSFKKWKIEKASEGDGTVPIKSAIPIDGDLNELFLIKTKKLLSGKYTHAILCEREDVQKFCVSEVRKTKLDNPKYKAYGVAAYDTPGIDDYKEAAKQLLRNNKWKGKVLSLFRLMPIDDNPLVDTTKTTRVQPGGSKEEVVLKNPPEHLTDPVVEKINFPRFGEKEYVRISAHQDANSGVGGWLFLPDPRLGFVDVLGHLTQRLEEKYYKSCDNANHAENQAINWIEHQPHDFKKRIYRVFVWNSSLDKNVEGWSPCGYCCDSLRYLFVQLENSGSPKGYIEWKKAYKNREKCGHPTKKEHLEMLKRVGWVISPDSEKIIQD